MMRRLLVVLAVTLVAACSNDGPGGERLFAFLSGLTEVPPIPAAISSGSVTFTLADDHIDYAITVQNITGVTHAHIQSGDAGVVGPVIVDLYNGPTTGAIAFGTLASGTITAANLTAISLDSLKFLMRQSHAYVNIKTVSQSNGEIRGQIAPN